MIGFAAMSNTLLLTGKRPGPYGVVAGKLMVLVLISLLSNTVARIDAVSDGLFLETHLAYPRFIMQNATQEVMRLSFTLSAFLTPVRSICFIS